MTMPYNTLAGQNTLMDYQQEANRREGSKQSADQQMAINPLRTPEENKQVSDNLVNISGNIQQTADAGAAGMLATRQQQEAARQQQEFMQQQQDSIDSLKQQQAIYTNQMNDMYAELQKSQQAAITSQFNAGGGITTQQYAQLSGDQYTGNAAQIAQYARQAGFPEAAIPEAVAIAMAESGGRADAVNTANRNGSVDRGLMQINSIHSNLLKQYDWKDPLQNMQMAYQIWKGAGGKFTPWATYNNGSYQNYVPLGNVANATSQRLYPIQPANLKPYVANTAKGVGQAVVSAAKQYIGVPYKWGGTNTNGIDCSGLVQAVYKQMGINLPRVANDQARFGKRVSIKDLQPGDLVAWSGNRAGKGKDYVGHIAIYAGNGNIIEAYTSGTDVMEVPLSRRTRGLRIDENVYGIKITVGKK